MKTLLILVFDIVISASLFGQRELPLHKNNLIYEAATIQRLRALADSLNLTFRTCDLPHPYYSLPQGTADYFLFDKNISAVEKAIRQKLSPEELLKQFPPAEIRRSVNIVRTSYTYKNEKSIRYAKFPQSDDDGILDVDLPYTAGNIKTGGWVSNGNSSYVWAYYVDYLKVKEIPAHYARFIQYVDCMIDTTSHVFFGAPAPASYTATVDNSMAERFLLWANDYPNKPVLVELAVQENPTDEDLKLNQQLYERYYTDYQRWDRRRLADLDVRMRNSSYWRSVLREVTNKAIRYGNTDDELEAYIERYLSLEIALYLKRKRRVVGTCSRDERPRVHAMNICMLAARTAKWNVFLRSHLDLMNDRFERTSDGSWAFEGRRTYLKELEALDIRVTDLLLGSVLRTSSVSDNHYRGDPARIGRALAESSTPDAVHKQILAMINDPRLDLFNKTLLEILLLNFNHYLTASKKG